MTFGCLSAMNMGICIRPVVKIRSRILSTLVGSETYCVHLLSRVLETNAERYFERGNKNNLIPCVLGSPATTFETGRLSDALSASVSSKKSG